VIPFFDRQLGFSFIAKKREHVFNAVLETLMRMLFPTVRHGVVSSKNVQRFSIFGSMVLPFISADYRTPQTPSVASSYAHCHPGPSVLAGFRMVQEYTGSGLGFFMTCRQRLNLSNA